MTTTELARKLRQESSRSLQEQEGQAEVFQPFLHLWRLEQAVVAVLETAVNHALDRVILDQTFEAFEPRLEAGHPSARRLEQVPSGQSLDRR